MYKLYEDYVAEGLCPRCHTKIPEGHDRVLCPSCVAKSNAAAELLRRARFAKGLCTTCGGPKLASNYKTCEACREHGTKSRKLLEQRRRDAQECPRCGASVAGTDYICCPSCREFFRERARKQKEGG